jgi:hypothetical protein
VPCVEDEEVKEQFVGQAFVHFRAGEKRKAQGNVWSLGPSAHLQLSNGVILGISCWFESGGDVYQITGFFERRSGRSVSERSIGAFKIRTRRVSLIRLSKRLVIGISHIPNIEEVVDEESLPAKDEVERAIQRRWNVTGGTKPSRKKGKGKLSKKKPTQQKKRSIPEEQEQGEEEEE